MGLFDSIINDAAAAPLIPQPVAQQVIKELPQSSAAMQLFRKVNMGTKTDKMPVINSMPTASFGNGSSGLAQLSGAEWKNVELVAEVVTSIVVIPNDVVDDSGVPLWDEVRPMAVESIAIALDKAALFSIGKPNSWPEGIVPQALAAGNVIVRGTAAQNKGGVYTDLINLMFKVRGQGYAVNGIAADDMFEQQLLTATDTQGRPLVDWNSEQKRVVGKNLAFSGAGVWPGTASSAEAIAGDMSKAILGVRQDIGFKMLTEGVITDDDNQIVYNLPQQRMTALFLFARFGFAVAKPATRKKAGDDVRCPFGVLQSPA
jgi:HK97 family phage major capsid protein